MSHPLQTQLRTSVWSLLLATALLTIGTGAVQAQTLQDGPYAIRAAEGSWYLRWIGDDGKELRVRDEPVELGKVVTVAPVGSLPPFQVKLRAAAQPASEGIPLEPGTPIFVMADTHGEFEIAVLLLQRHGVIDRNLKWSFGRGHLAVLGDVFDRGPNQTELMWLLYQLEAEAANAGGGLHLAIGNHEAMLLTGDDRYLNSKYRRVESLLGGQRYVSLWGEQTLLGQWLRSKAAVFRLGEYLCLHGGISRELIDRGLTLPQVNQAVRAALRAGSAERQTEFVMGPEGPLWYRGYFQDAARQGGFKVAEQSDVELIRTRFGVEAILVGHTTVPTITSLYGGRVIAVQVYPHRDEQTHAPVMEGLFISKEGEMFRARADGSREMLSRS